MMYLGFVMIGLGLIVVIAGLVQRGKMKKILAAPFKKTGEIASNPSVADAKGLVSCEGAVSSQQPVIAPCSNSQCVYYELKVEKQVEESKMTDKGLQTSRTWKNVSEQKQGSCFQVNDGSGPLNVDAREGIDADLKQAYSGAPPGGQGLGILANMLTGAIFGGNERILQYRATERIIPAQGNLFVMGKLAGGQITKTDGMMGKLMLSTKGRDGLVGSVKTLSLILLIVGGLLGVGGIPVAIFGDPPKDTACKPPFTDELKEECTGAMKTAKEEFKWKVTKPGKYEITFKQPKDATVSSWPTIVVETEDGFPVNNPFNLGISDQTVKVSVEKGTYTIRIFGVDGSRLEGGFRYIFGIKYKGALDKDGTKKAGADDGDDKSADDKGSDDDKPAPKKKKGSDDK
jgi:hypothetical protein